MDLDPVLTRRAALATGAAGLGVAALAACGAGSSSPGGGANQAPTQPKADATLAALDKITVGQAVSAALPDGSPVIVARPTASTAACFSAICTHMGCTVAPAGTELHCPCHGSVYDATTGAVISGPAPRPLPKIDVTVEHGDVVTG